MPVFSLVLDYDVRDEIAMMYPELYKDLVKGRALSLKTFFTWLLISVFQGGSIMALSLVLFETKFIHIISISFTALILNELFMVALEIQKWHKIMVLCQVLSLLSYFLSILIFPTDISNSKWPDSY